MIYEDVMFTSYTVRSTCSMISFTYKKLVLSFGGGLLVLVDFHSPCSSSEALWHSGSFGESWRWFSTSSMGWSFSLTSCTIGLFIYLKAITFLGTSVLIFTYSAIWRHISIFPWWLVCSPCCVKWCLPRSALINVVWLKNLSVSLNLSVWHHSLTHF